MTDLLKGPQAVSRGDLVEDFACTDAEKDQIQKGVQATVLASRVHRLAELRKRQHTTQVQVAEPMGVTQARVSRIEEGRLGRREVDTLAAYVRGWPDRQAAAKVPALSAGQVRLSMSGMMALGCPWWSIIALVRESAVRGFCPLG
ncbi:MULTISPECIES: helix-turn-helix domain-containing protein [Streptomyces]|uniref:helix-turn-helix domain-containing protein n=1 Tax=Streptomyces TaxID=1883 RepID=UPI0036A1B9D0